MCDSATPRPKARLYPSSPTEVCERESLLFFCQRNANVSSAELWMCWKSACGSECRCVCLRVSLLFALDKETSWSCGLCIIDSVGHGKAPLAPIIITHHLHPFSSNMQVHTADEGEGERKGKEEREEQGGEGCVVGGTCRFMIIPKQMLLLKSLWIAKRGCSPGIHKSKYQLIRGRRWKKGRCEMRFMLSCFCISASCTALSSSYYSLPRQSRLAKGTA